MTNWVRKINLRVGALVGFVMFLGIGLTFANHQASHKLRIAAVATKTVAQKAVLSDSFQKLGYILELGRTRAYAVSDATASQRVSTEVNITNTSDTVLQIAPGLQMTLIDGMGHIHPATAKYLLESEVVGGPIAPSESAVLTIDFDIPAGTVAKTFTFQKDAASESTVIAL